MNPLQALLAAILGNTANTPNPAPAVTGTNNSTTGQQPVTAPSSGNEGIGDILNTIIGSQERMQENSLNALQSFAPSRGINRLDISGNPAGSPSSLDRFYSTNPQAADRSVSGFNQRVYGQANPYVQPGFGESFAALVDQQNQDAQTLRDVASQGNAQTPYGTVSTVPTGQPSNMTIGQGVENNFGATLEALLPAMSAAQQNGQSSNMWQRYLSPQQQVNSIIPLAQRRR